MKSAEILEYWKTGNEKVILVMFSWTPTLVGEVWGPWKNSNLESARRILDFKTCYISEQWGSLGCYSKNRLFKKKRAESRWRKKVKESHNFKWSFCVDLKVAGIKVLELVYYLGAKGLSEKWWGWDGIRISRRCNCQKVFVGSSLNAKKKCLEK